MNMQPATLEHSTGRPVKGYADRDEFDSDAPYVHVQFDATSRSVGVHRSKVLAFDTPTLTETQRTPSQQPTRGGQAVIRLRDGVLGITTDEPAKRTPTIAVQWVGMHYPVRMQLDAVVRVEIAAVA